MVKVVEWGGYYQEVTLRLWQLRAFPFLVLPFVEWRADDQHWGNLYGLPPERFGFPWLGFGFRWHAGWQDGRALNIEMRVHRQ